MKYMNEVSKIRERITKYLFLADILDIGCADCKVTPNAFGVDGREFDGVDLVTDNLFGLGWQLKWRTFDVLFSSHCLEHLPDQYGAILAWTDLIKEDGYLILYLPQAGRYDHYQNKEHMVNMEYEDFLFWFKRAWCGEGKDFKGENLTPVFRLIESGEDPHEEDLYSFYIVAQKL